MPVLEPSTAAEAASQLQAAEQQGLAVVVRGLGTKATWGTPPSRVDRVLSTARLREPIEHYAGDLVVTAPAGATLREVNTLLAQQGQWLPLDPWAGAGCTIGGLLATNDSGPRRQRHGAPRDLVIGVEFALVDGRTARAGGRVVKNVAGYDLGRLLCGSFGTLAVITSATFKLAPLPEASRTVAIEAPDWPALAPLLRALAQSPLTPAAAEVSGPAARLLIRFETTATAADQMAAAAMGMAAAHGAGATLLQGAGEAAAWQGHHAPSATAVPPTVARVNVLPSHLATTVALAAAEAEASGVGLRVTGRALLGALMVQFSGDDRAVAALLAHLRKTLAAQAAGHLDILTAPPAVTAAVPRWTDIGAAAAVMRAVKAQFDPRGTLCPGGGPGGLA